MSSGNGGNGGIATANAAGNSYGTNPAVVQATATGGAGGTHSGMGFNSGLGGDAYASAYRNQLFNAALLRVSATATGGISPGLLVDGSAIASAAATGPSGTATASAFSGGGATVNVSTSAIAQVASSSSSESRAAASEAFPNSSLANGVQAAAYAVGMPIAGDVTAAVAGNPHSTQMVGGGANVLGMMLLGGAYSNSGSGASKTYISSATFKIDLTQLASFQDLQLAALDATKSGTGFDSLRLEVIREGVAIIDSTTNDAIDNAWQFSDFVFNLDDIETGIADNMLDVTVRLSLTTDELDAGFRSLFILANSPLAPYDGDYNNNGIVDAADYVVWRNGLGTTYTQSDYYVWRDQFGQMIPGSGSGLESHAAVPEPAAAVMLFIGLLTTLFRRRTHVS